MLTTLLAALVLSSCSAQPETGAQFTVTPTVLRTAAQTPPLGANGWGRIGAIEYAANNLIANPGNEPMHWRNLHRAVSVGPNWFEIDGGGASWYDLWSSGFLSGASLRIYRLVDQAGNALPVQGNNLDIALASRVAFVGKAQVAPAGSPGLPDGGWVANGSVPVQGNTLRDTTAVDAMGLENGRSYWYAVRALAADGSESAPSVEVEVAPRADAQAGPQFVMTPNENGMPLVAGQDIWWSPKVAGGVAPYRLSVEGSLPAGLRFEAENGMLAGKPEAVTPQTQITFRVTDARGQTSTRTFGAKPPAGDKQDLAAPTGLQATGLDGMVRLTWNAVPGASGYRLYRSPARPDERENRVYLAPGGPKLERYDYIVIGKKWLDFPMDAVSPRVRGIGNPVDSPDFYWRRDVNRVDLKLAQHPAPVPADLVEPGESCLQASAKPGVTGLVDINQITLISANIPGEGLWYGQLEPEKRYKAEFWLRGKGLGDGGRVTFSFGHGYPDLRTTWVVGDSWKRYEHEFVAPDRPLDKWHFGQKLEFTAPGTLWMDNARIARVDSPAEADKLYTPNRTVLDELLASQPAQGRKGTHRIWFLNRDATMDSILSWYPNSRVSPDWYTGVSATLDMALPAALMFTEATGDSADTRMRPYLVLQHILHSEQDWRNLIEYLAAPYDPAKDSPRAKPYAYRRTQHRGDTRPWTDVFSQIRIEFGNETWHNGVFSDWLGFSLFGNVTQGGKEYGLFTKYLVEEIKRSPYWKSQGLDGKLGFVLGAFYNGDLDWEGKVVGYGEEAIRENPHVADLGHANYVGPKWETGEAAQTTFTDDGVQATLLSWVQCMEPQVQGWARAREALAKQGVNYDLVAYEGGPSGYTLPGQGSPEVVEVNEKYGKSLAMAVAALDSWLGSYGYGYTDQTFLGYGQGQYWNSHTDLARGFRPTPGWLALTLRNRIGRGDLVRVDASDVPAVTRGKDTYPGVAVYAMREGKRWTVFVLSRRLKDATPVTLSLPFARAGKVTEHRLAGDPRANNRESMNVQLEQRELPADAVRQGKLSFSMPAGSIVAFVLEEA